MNTKDEQLSALNDIRNLMDRSSRFISLSGLSGIVAGITALVGAYLAHQELISSAASNDELLFTLITIAFVVLIVALTGGFVFTYRQSKKKGVPMWDKAAKTLIINLLIPLLTGGIFILAILSEFNRSYGLVAPSCLIFYGLALVNASKYTYTDIRFLGLCEIALGLISLYNIGYGLYFWAIGFGVLHILYGTIMYFKYERT